MDSGNPPGAYFTCHWHLRNTCQYDVPRAGELRFWITKNSQLSIREQLVRQVTLAILSEDLPAGRKLPSIRALARRHKVHSNTVSAAYHQLLEQGWLELRRGSGLYVRSRSASDGHSDGLDALLRDLLHTSHRLGFEPALVLERLKGLIVPRASSRILVAEPDAGMREILLAEIREQLPLPAEAFECAALPAAGLVVSLPGHAAAVRSRLPEHAPYFQLRLRSVRDSLEKETRLGPKAIVSVVSRAPLFRQTALAMLIAVGLDPACLCEIDSALDGWQERARAATLVIADIVAAASLPAGCKTRIFRVIADVSLAEMKQLCGL